MVQTLSDFLHTQAYQVAVAYSGLEAVENARKLRPSLILLDNQMPGLSGLDAIRRLRAEPGEHLAAIPFIAVTSLSLAGDRETCLAAGANDYLTKPMRFSDLAAAIETALQPRV